MKITKHILCGWDIWEGKMDLTREELKKILDAIPTQSVQVTNCSFEMLRWIEDGPESVRGLLNEIDRLTLSAAESQREVEELKRRHDFDVKRLRVLARVAGCEEGVPDDATAVACAGVVLGMIRHNVERIVAERDKLKFVLKEVSGCHEKHGTPKLCEGCLISINQAVPQS